MILDPIVKAIVKFDVDKIEGSLISDPIYKGSVSIAGSGGPIPSGNIDIHANGDYNVSSYATAKVDVPMPDPPSGSIELTSNGPHDVTNYATAMVSVPMPDPPTETLDITENGHYDVLDYAGAEVNVPIPPQPSGTVQITSNGTHDVKDYESAEVNVPIPPQPSGTLDITENGPYDVTQYSDVDVNVPIPPQPSGSYDITENGDYDITDYAIARVNVPTGERTEIFPVACGVNFIDYDGTIIASWPSDEVSSKASLPANPVHTNDIKWGNHTISLDSQGWNWTLAAIKSYIQKYPKARLSVGQMYKTSDNGIHICARLTSGRLNPAVNLTVNTGSATIDWGDGTPPQSFVSARDNTHTYSEPGDYDIAIYPTTSSTKFTIVGNSSGTQLLQKPNNTAANNERVYSGSIKKIFIPTNTSLTNYSFYYATSLDSVTLPKGITSIGINCFYYCYTIKAIIIPDTVTSIGNSFARNATSVLYFSLPNNLTTIGTYCFGNALCLETMAIPEGLSALSDSSFSLDSRMASIIIPTGITSIGASVFNNCYGLGEVIFTRSTPPTVSNSNTWTGLPSDCKFYIPSGTLSAYTSATNYPDSSTYEYIEY